MSLYTYSKASLAIGEQLAATLEPEEYEDVYRIMSRFSYAEWQDWRTRHAAAVKKLATATPSAQRMLVKKHSREDKMLHVFAAVQYCFEAFEILDAIARIEIGSSYREMIGIAHDTLGQINDNRVSRWPWKGPMTYRDDT